MSSLQELLEKELLEREEVDGEEGDDKEEGGEPSSKLNSSSSYR